MGVGVVTSAAAHFGGAGGGVDGWRWALWCSAGALVVTVLLRERFRGEAAA